MHTCIHAYMHAYMHTCIHAYMHTCMHTCIHAYMHTCIHACIHAYMHTCIHACMHACMHTYIHTYTHIHTYIHTYIHTSSTAQGGGGGFKNRKPIGEPCCRESRMAERIHWWTERWLELCFLKWLQRLQWSPLPQLLDEVWCGLAQL